MKEINLREYYPDFYTTDYIIEVPDEVLETMEEAARYQALTPQDICEQQEMMEQISMAISMLPEKQARRIHAHYFHGMSFAEIAAEEGVHRSQIMRSINRALAHMAIILKN